MALLDIPTLGLGRESARVLIPTFAQVCGRRGTKQYTSTILVEDRLLTRKYLGKSRRTRDPSVPAGYRRKALAPGIVL
jgi:hypothetical protein